MSTWRDEQRGAAERDPRRVGEYLDRATDGIGVPNAALLGMLFSKWPQLVGDDIAAHTEPRSLREGVLTVSVDQPAWAAQLGYLGSDLVVKIASFTGSSEVSEIQFRVAGEGPRTGREKSGRRPSRTPD